VMRPVGCVQQSLRARSDLAAMVQDDVADQHADLAAAWLACAHDCVTPRREPLLQERRLRGLADAVAAFERDEQTPLRFRSSLGWTGIARGWLGNLEGHFFAGAFRVVAALRAGARLGAGPLARLSAIICTAIS